MEIWDYKGSRLPKASDPRMKEYEWQMTVYAELFKRKNGVYPKQAILYFLNELDVNPVPTKRPLRAVHTVTFNQGNVDRAISEFDRSEEHTSELQSLMRTSYAVFCLKKNKTN